MALYLTGGGDQEDFRDLDAHFLNQLAPESQILVVPHALDEEDYDDALSRAEECFESHKVKAFELFTGEAHLDFDFLNSFDTVFIEGGNTFQLIQSIRETELFQLLMDFEQNGGSIYADSAGAIILGEDVRTAFIGETADEDLEKLQDYRGLGIIPGWSVHCHHMPEEEAEVKDLMYELGTPVLALAEPTAILLAQNRITVFGQVGLDIFTFTGVYRMEPGQSFALAQALSW